MSNSLIEIGKKIDQYTLIKFIGSGSFAQVWTCENDLNEKYAIKIFLENVRENFQNLIEREYSEIFNINHPNIIVPLEHGYYMGIPYLIYPLCDGNLNHELNRRIITKKVEKKESVNLFTENELSEILLSIVNALVYLKEIKIIHNDIKPSNILYRKSNDGKSSYLLSDFGVSYFLNKTKLLKNSEHASTIESEYGGLSLAYAAPEALKNKNSYESDVFALGVTIYECACGVLPSGYNQFGLGYTLLNGGEIIELKGDYSNDFKTLLYSMMTTDTFNRVSLDFIKLSTEKFIQTGSWIKLKDWKTNSLSDPSNNNYTRITSQTSSSFENFRFQSWRLLKVVSIIAVLFLLGIMYWNRSTKLKVSRAMANGNYSLAMDLASRFYFNNEAAFIERAKQKYELLMPLVDGYIPVQVKGKMGLLNQEFKEVLPPVFNKIVVKNGAILTECELGQWGARNYQLEIIFKCEYESISFEQNYKFLKAKSIFSGEIFSKPIIQ